MPSYGSFSDDYYVNLHLTTEMDLPSGRETILAHFEQLRRRYSAMKNFYMRERGEFVLEEEKDGGSYRWASVDQKRVSAGAVNPQEVEQAQKLHQDVLDLAPYTLSVSSLDCETLNLMFGFDFTCRGNHNEIVAQALGLPPCFEKLRETPGASLLGQDPNIQMAIDEDCRTQVRVAIETRTTAYQIRTGDFPEEHLSAYLTVRRFGGLDSGETWHDALARLYSIADELISNYMVENILRPLQLTIAAK